ncbi:MAG: tRNA uracil 4-sulfurtransferase ThiI [Bacilli bacterium]
MEKIILIKFAELGTKGKNKNNFIRILVNNINKQLEKYNVKVSKMHMRVLVTCKKDILSNVCEILKFTPGIKSIVVCEKVENDLDKIKTLVINSLKNRTFSTFKVNTKRANKNFEIPSMEFNKIIGGTILKTIENINVNVINPDINLKIEIRETYTVIYDSKLIIESVGGYPVSSLSTGMMMISGGIDSPVASFLSMKRGMKLEFLYFESLPHTSLKAREKVIDLLKILTKFQYNIKLHIVPFTKIQEEIYKNCDESYMITILRRMMYRIGSKYANMKDIKILVNGESVGQVASQTIESINTINSVTNMPILRPVACFDKTEIIELAKKIGTYDISIRPFEDCCTIFLPKNPVISPTIERAIINEKRFEYESLIDKTIENIFSIDISNKPIDEFDDLF